MVKVLVGSPGSGKTKIMINNANNLIGEVRGTFVYLENTDKHMQLLNSKIRFISTEKFKMDSYDTMYGFICGLTSANYDIQKIFIDGLFKIINEDETKLLKFLEEIEKISSESDTQIVIAITLSNEETQKQIQKYIVTEENM